MPVTTDVLIRPHGGALVNRVADPRERADALAAASRLPAIRLTAVQHSDLFCIATGVFSPLIGFAGRADYESILDRMRLADGVVWSIPITLAVSADVAKSLGRRGTAALEDPAGRIVATMEVTDQFSYDKPREADAVYRTTDTAHPGVARLYGQGDVLLAGPVTLLERPVDEPFAAFRRDPADTRRLFADRGWRRVVGFQTRNPVHRAHEYIQKAALEMCDGLLLNPLVGETKSDDISAATRMESYHVLIDKVLSEGSCRLERLSGGDAIRRAAGGHFSCDVAEELRLHALHRRARSRGRGQLLRDLRCAEDLRRLHP